MQIVEPSFEIIAAMEGIAALRHIEVIARTCYKSEDRITDDSALAFCRGLVKRRHFPMLDHLSFTVRFVVDCGVGREMTRHRLCAFAQESSRFCDYGGKGITLIHPPGLSVAQIARREEHYWATEALYDAERDAGVPPEIARGVLPFALKTELVWTCDITEWRHVFRLRAEGTTGRPHPQMLEVMVPLLAEVKQRFPIMFDDIQVQ